MRFGEIISALDVDCFYIWDFEREEKHRCYEKPEGFKPAVGMLVSFEVEEHPFRDRVFSVQVAHKDDLSKRQKNRLLFPIPYQLPL